MKRIIRTLTFILIVGLLTPFKPYSQQFVEAISISDSLTDVSGSSVSWGDYDNDGDLDILLSGWDQNLDSYTEIYRNDSGTFSEIGAGLAPVSYSSVAWGDYDNDEDLDIIVTGWDGISSSTSKIYQNNNGIFTDIQAGIIPINGNSTAWGDYDNDGDLDILVTGAQDGLPIRLITRIYHNNGTGTFTVINPGMIDIARGSAKWGDCDNDGDLDILLCGVDAQAVPYSIIYRNDSGTFTDLNAGLTGVDNCDSAWGDFDNDGDLDILISGLRSDTIPISKIYRNDAGTFIDINANLLGLYHSTVAWGDFDNDGDLDILVAGLDSSIFSRTKLYRNDMGTFTDTWSSLMPVIRGSVAWGDYDNDGDLDILLTGTAPSRVYSKVYRNDRYITNRPCHTPPTNLTAFQTSSNDLQFTWDAAKDSITPTNGLSYRLWIGTVNDSFNVSSAMADTTSGLRRIAAMGNIQGTSWTFKEAVPGQTYFASVSAVDGGLMGSQSSNSLSTMIVGKPENQVSLTLIAGPNPTTGSITVKIKDHFDNRINYLLTDLQGNTIKGINGSFYKEKSLNLEMLPAGLYLLRLEFPGFTKPKILKIIKQ